MKRIAFLITAAAVCFTPWMRAQDAATEERLNKLTGQIEDLRSANEALRKQLESLLKEIELVREQAGKPTGNYASQEDLNRLRDAIKEVDKKRLDDGEKVRTELLNIRKAVLTQPSLPKKSAVVPTSETPSSDKPQKGFEYVVQKGDTLSLIAKACREEKNIKVTTDQIQKANPGLKADRLVPGQKLFIPGPQS